MGSSGTDRADIFVSIEVFMSKIDINDNLSEEKARLYSPLALAYIGDSVYELMVRNLIVLENNMRVSTMHKRATEFVSARAQSEIMGAIANDLTDKELEIYKRGRNAKVHTMAKNMSVEDYKKSTGFEALIGYLFITGKKDRLDEIFKMAACHVENKKHKESHQQP
jgi:ribonuclease-3 family protein